MNSESSDSTLYKMFRLISFLEGLSFILLLGVAVPLKHMMGMPEPVSILGMAHGVLFMLYVIFVLMLQPSQEWPAKTTALILLLSILPLGTFYGERKQFWTK